MVAWNTSAAKCTREPADEHETSFEISGRKADSFFFRFCSKRIEASIKEITEKSESKKMEVSLFGGPRTAFSID